MKFGPVVYLAAQRAYEPEGKSMGEQTKQALRALDDSLWTAGTSKHHLLKVTL